MVLLVIAHFDISLGGFPYYLQLFIMDVTYCWNPYLPRIVIEDGPQSYSFVPCSVQGLLITVSYYTTAMPGLIWGLILEVLQPCLITKSFHWTLDKGLHIIYHLHSALLQAIIVPIFLPGCISHLCVTVNIF